MFGRVSARLRESLRAFAEVNRNRNLRKLELALAASTTGSWAYGVALGVYSYDVGGAGLVGVAAFVRITPAALAAPFAGVLADRYPRSRVMVASDGSRVVVLLAAALAVLLDAPAAIVFTLAGLAALLATPFGPAQRALLPALASTPEELTAANAATSMIDGAAIFVGPALGGVLLAATSTEVVFATTAAALVWSAALLTGISGGNVAPTADEPKEEPLLHQALGGFRAIGSNAPLRLLVSLLAGQTLVCGALNVLAVVMAIELLDMGESGVGFLLAAVGIGGLLGTLAALTLVGRRHLAGAFTIGLALWGLPIALIAAWPEPAVALVLLALVGVGNTIVDVAGLTLMQRSVPDEVLGRVFGVLESLIIGTIAVGGLLAPALVEGLGTRPALVATGALLPALALLSWRRLSAIDAAASVPERELSVLRSVAIFAQLPAPALEQLASRLEPARIRTGEEIFRQGEAGDRFYVIGEGEVDVFVDGRFVRTEGAGDHFGEIALLRDVPRTATVRARTDVEVYALERDEFISAVTGHPQSAETTDAVITARLARARPEVVSV